ncbi:MAG TPA: ester cyclase [Propionibacteriaceae bacterium]|nr:ester cyclase [Propionibacteriaceae bacterium]
MAAEEGKATILRFVEARNSNNIDDAVACWVAEERDGLRHAFAMITTAFPDVHITAEDLIGEGDKVALRWTLRGTHQGPFQGIPPTGRTVEWPGVDLYTVEGGQISRLVRGADLLTLLQQLDVAAPPVK